MGGKILIIAEKPSVAGDIAKAIGGLKRNAEGYYENDSVIVSNAIGHLVEVYAPEAETTGKDLTTLPVIPTQFSLKQNESTKQQLRLLKKLFTRTDVESVVNACDAGREGEEIFRRIYTFLGCRKTMKRMWLQSMTSDAIKAAYSNMQPGSKYDPLGAAARCRSQADWLIGINGSRGVTALNSLQKRRYEGMAVGRVQTPTLSLIVQRENEILNFKPQIFFNVVGSFKVKAGLYQGTWTPKAEKPQEEGSEDKEDESSRLFDKAKALELVSKCKGVVPDFTKDTVTAQKRQPPKLYDLTTLQREANSKFKLSAKETLTIVQALYETHKASTYPRTDSNALPEDYVEQVKTILQAFNGTQYGLLSEQVLKNDWVQGGNKRIFNNKEISDHFAITPTGTKPSGLSQKEELIYDLIVRRFIAAFYPSAEFNRTTRITQVAGETFKTTGSVMVNAGWQAVYNNGTKDSKDTSMCALEPNENAHNLGVDLKEGLTTPPVRYTENTLLAAMGSAGKFVDDAEVSKAMRERGLGTPATRAEIIEGLLRDKDAKKRPKEPYMRREGKEQYLTPTDKGKTLITFLVSNSIEALTSPAMTGEWEQQLALIEQGKLSAQEFMKSIANQTIQIIDVIRQQSKTIPQQEERRLEKLCPGCGSDVLVKPRTFECVNSPGACTFKLWNSILDRELSIEELQTLVQKGSIDNLSGFKGKKAGSKFDAGLRLVKDENGMYKAEFVFDTSGDTVTNLGAPCPIPGCGAGFQKKTRRGVNYALYSCSKCDFKVYGSISGKVLTDEEIKTLLREKKLAQSFGFTSKTGKPFGAGLILKKSGKLEFIFEGD